MMPHLNSTFRVQKSDLSNAEFVEAPVPAIQAGEVLLKIDTYLLASNNITYAVMGDALKYWQFFPVEEPYGIIPVWGHATVAESTHHEIKVGERVFGYFPMSQFLTIKVDRTTPYGFSDSSTHRKELHSIYNYYTRIDPQSLTNEKKADFALLSQITFPTSFLIYYLLADNSFFGAEQCVVTSASSKTSLGLAYMLKKNQAVDGKKIIGLTSVRNVDFVKRTGYYDEVISYDEVEKEVPNLPTAVLDMAGNAKVLFRLHDAFGDKLVHISRIGLADWSAEKSLTGLPNVVPFFAGTQMQRKLKEWGVEQATLKMKTGISDFAEDAKKWMSFTHLKHNDSVSDFYQNLLTGGFDPSHGYLVQNFKK